MAQAIYREWFVHFRFPGHELVKQVDTKFGFVPDKWDIVSLEDVCKDITDGSHYSPPSISGDGYPMASVKDMTDWGIEINSCRTISEEDYLRLVKTNCKPFVGDVLVAKDGSYLKHIFAIHKELEFVVLSSIAILRPNQRIHSQILCNYLLSPFVKSRMSGYVSGVAIPRIILKDFRKFPILMPPINIQNEYMDVTGSIFNLIHVLIEKNTNLKSTRDLLLPRLINGELEVSEMEIEAGEVPFRQDA